MGFFVNALPLRLRDRRRHQLPRAAAPRAQRGRRRVRRPGRAVRAPGARARRPSATRAGPRSTRRSSRTRTRASARRAGATSTHDNLPVFQPRRRRTSRCGSSKAPTAWSAASTTTPTSSTRETAQRWRQRFLAARRGGRRRARIARCASCSRSPARSARSSSRGTPPRAPLAGDATLTQLLAPLGQHGERIAVRQPAARSPPSPTPRSPCSAIASRAALAARGIGAATLVGPASSSATPAMLSALLGMLARRRRLPAARSRLPRRAARVHARRRRRSLSSSPTRDLTGDVLAPLELRPRDRPRHRRARRRRRCRSRRATGRHGRPRRRGVRDLHLGLDRPAQGRARAAPRGRQLPRQRCASARASPPATRSSPSPRCRSTSPCSSCSCRSRSAPRSCSPPATRPPTASRCAALLEQHARHRHAGHARRPGACCSRPAGAAAPASRRCAAARRCPRELAESLLPRVGELWNMYGPTETTVWSTCAPRRGRAGRHRRSAARSPTPQIRSSTTPATPVPIGVPGELYIGGAGVALGYHAAPDADRGALRRRPASARRAARLYRTGDLGALARRRPARVPRPHRPPGQAARLPHRARRDRGRARAPRPTSPRPSSSPSPAPVASSASSRYFVARGAAPARRGPARAPARARCPTTWCRPRSSPLDALPLTPNGKIDRQRAAGPRRPARRAGRPGQRPAQPRRAARRRRLARGARRRADRRSPTTSSTSAATRC